MRTSFYIKARHLTPNARKLARTKGDVLMATGAKLNAKKIGCVWHYYVHGYEANGYDLIWYQAFALDSESIPHNQGDVDGDKALTYEERHNDTAKWARRFFSGQEKLRSEGGMKLSVNSLLK